MTIKKPVLPDTNQNFWQLVSIQSAAQSIPGMFLGKHLADKYGNGTALASICVGNMILWLIGLTLVTMTSKDRSNAMENVISYLGKFAGIFASLLLIIAFLIFYSIGIETTISAFDYLFESHEGWCGDLNIRIGIALGFTTALLVIGGIKLIKWICVIAFPFLLLYLLYLMFSFDYHPQFSGTWGISFAASLSAMAITLPGFVNIPTFFRHSRSHYDSFLALTLITMFDILFEISSIFMGISNFSTLFQNQIVFIPFLYLILSLICLNLVNIYFVSAGGQILFPYLWQAKEYAIIGMLGVVIYAFLQSFPIMEFLENMSANFISSLGVVLLLAFIMRIVTKHRPRPFEKMINITVWLVSCAVALKFQIQNPNNFSIPLISGISASFIFICCFF